MNYSDYRKREVEISNHVNKYILNFCDKNPEYKTIAEIYTSKKIHLNSIQFVAGFEAFLKNKNSWDEYIVVPIIIELIMIWAYKTNQIIDQKKNIWDSNEKIIDNVLTHDLILSCILNLLESSRPKLKEKYYLVSMYVLYLLKQLPIGFQIEKQFLNTKNNKLNDILKNWEKNYTLRNIKFNSLYDYTPMIGYYIASGIDVIPKYQKMISDSRKFSNVGQIINDLSDCIPQVDSFEKTYQDQYADIRNGIVTYPIFKLINFKATKEALNNGKISLNKNWQTEYLKELIKSGVVEEIKEIAKESYELHANFWESILNSKNDFLNRTYKLLLNNKYFNKTFNA